MESHLNSIITATLPEGSNFVSINASKSNGTSDEDCNYKVIH